MWRETVDPWICRDQFTTLRSANTPEEGVLDSHCRVWGVDNLFVTDGSFMPTSGGVNPSLTIAANALRIAERMMKG